MFRKMRKKDVSEDESEEDRFDPVEEVDDELQVVDYEEYTSDDWSEEVFYEAPSCDIQKVESVVCFAKAESSYKMDDFLIRSLDAHSPESTLGTPSSSAIGLDDFELYAETLGNAGSLDGLEEYLRKLDLMTASGAHLLGRDRGILLAAIMLVGDDLSDERIHGWLTSMPPSDGRNYILGFMKMAGLGTEPDLEGAYALFKSSEYGRHMASVMLGMNMVDDPDETESEFMSQISNVALNMMDLRDAVSSGVEADIIAGLRSLCESCRDSDECIQYAVFEHILGMIGHVGDPLTASRMVGLIRNNLPYSTSLYTYLLESFCKEHNIYLHSPLLGRGAVLCEPRIALMCGDVLAHMLDEAEGMLIDAVQRFPEWSGDAVVNVWKLRNPSATEIPERVRRVADVCAVRMVSCSIHIGF